MIDRCYQHYLQYHLNRLILQFLMYLKYRKYQRLLSYLSYQMNLKYQRKKIPRKIQHYLKIRLYLSYLKNR